MTPQASSRSSLREMAWQWRGVVRARVRRSLKRARHGLNWKVLRNPPSQSRYRTQRVQLGAAQAGVLAELTARGIAFTTPAALGVEATALQRLQALVDAFARSERVAAAIRDFPQALERRAMSGDDYLVKLYPEGPTLAADHPLLRVGLSAPILDVVNAYLGMWAKLTYTDAWHTIPVDPGRRIGSQSWHRDPEDRRMIKAYLYCADVDEGTGPMEYVVGSTAGGPYASRWPWHAAATHADRYPSEAEVDRAIPDAQRVRCTGPAGTLILCDTSGLHRGGISRTGPRVLATWTFITPAGLGVTVARRRFTVDRSAGDPGFAPAAAFALS